jgi:2-methylcitrate dehydratase PrpD
MQAESQTVRVARYVAGASERNYPAEILEDARKCLLDWVGVCMAAFDAPEAVAVTAMVEGWDSRGQARLLPGGNACAPAAALVNGTLSHCQDYDDTHIPSVIHVSGPLWATVLAVAAASGAEDELVLKAFVTGFEVCARLGDGGTGVRLTDNGWHATATLSGLGATAAAGVLLRLNQTQVGNALALAATQAGGLTASFGTMAKPFHAGKVAMDAVIAADLASKGFLGATGVLDEDSVLLRTLLQDRSVRLQMASFDADWEIRRNSFKPYAACQLAHAAIDAARKARETIGGREVESIRAFVHPLVAKIAGKRHAITSTEGKFSSAFCIALGLRGYAVTTRDFTPARLQDPDLVRVASLVELVPSGEVSRTAAHLEITLRSGSVVHESVEHAFGSIENPMGWAELEAKCRVLAADVVGTTRAGQLLTTLRNFGGAGSLERLFELTARPMQSQVTRDR